jgi:shikimate kinase
MHAAGRVVCLTAAPEVILRRVGSADTRPLLGGAPDPLRRIRELIAEREASYATADIRIDTSATTPPEIAERILEWLGR